MIKLTNQSQFQNRNQKGRWPVNQNQKPNRFTANSPPKTGQSGWYSPDPNKNKKPYSKWLCLNCFQCGHDTRNCTAPTIMLGQMQLMAGGQPIQSTASVVPTSMQQHGWSPGFTGTVQASVRDSHSPNTQGVQLNTNPTLFQG